MFQFSATSTLGKNILTLSRGTDGREEEHSEGMELRPDRGARVADRRYRTSLPTTSTPLPPMYGIFLTILSTGKLVSS